MPLYGTARVTAPGNPNSNPHWIGGYSTRLALPRGEAIIQVVPGVDTQAPVLLTVAVAGDQVTLTFDEALDPAWAATPSAFIVQVGGVPRKVTSVTLNGAQVSLTLASAVGAEAVNVSYSDAEVV